MKLMEVEYQAGILGKEMELARQIQTAILPVSAGAVQILSHLGVKFKGIDVLQDPELRQGIKEFANWPTIPQLYVKGEFVGGFDIMKEMFETGELPQLMEEKQVAAS